MRKLIFLILMIVLNSVVFSQKNAHDFAVTDIYGHTHKLYKDYTDKGQYVFLDFYNTGCGPCRIITPKIDTVFKEFGCNYSEIAFIGIEAYTNNNNVWYFSETYSMNFPPVSGIEGGGASVFTLYDISYTPLHMLISPERKIIIEDVKIEYSQDLRDTLLSYNFNMNQCKGNDFIFYSIISETDSVVADVDYENQLIDIELPSGTNLSNLRSTFVNAVNSTIEIDGVEQISGENILDFSDGPLIYEITSEVGITEEWTVNIYTVTAIEYYNDQIEIYPNPSNGFFSVDLTNVNGKEYQLQINDITGKIIYSSSISSMNTNIDISNYHTGVYLLKLSVDDVIINRRIIKNR